MEWQSQTGLRALACTAAVRILDIEWWLISAYQMICESRKQSFERSSLCDATIFKLNLKFSSKHFLSYTHTCTSDY